MDKITNIFINARHDFVTFWVWAWVTGSAHFAPFHKELRGMWDYTMASGGGL